MLLNIGISFLVGILSAFGVGGGSLLLLWLTLVRQLDYASAKCINLLFFLPAASVACFANFRQKRISVASVLPAVLCGCISTVFFSSVSSSWDTYYLKKLFGILLCISAFREFRCLQKAKKQQAE